MKNNLIFILTNPLFISLILTISLLFFFGSLFPKFKVDLIKKEKVHPNHLITYSDLDNDGYSEEIRIEKGYKDRISIIVRTKGVILNQWGFNGKLEMFFPFFGDFNNDGLKEIFLFTQYKNKILFNCLNPILNKTYITDRFIDDFYPQKGVQNFTVESFQLIDLNNDKIKELVFPINTGFPIYPRKLYSYNFVDDSLRNSINGCIPVKDVSLIRTLSNGSPTFSISTQAVANCDINSTYSDHFSWLTVFNKDLNFKFEPIKIGYYPSGLLVAPIKLITKYI